MNVIQGWEFDKNLGVYRIPITIKNPQSNERKTKYCLFDTGFSGYLGLDKETIGSLNLPKVGRGKGMSAKGIIDYDNYQGYLEIFVQNKDEEIYIKNLDGDENSPIIIQEFDMPIMGIKCIKQFSWLILAEKNLIYLMKEPQERKKIK